MANFHEHQRKGAITGCLAAAGCYFFFHFKEKEKNPEKKFNVLELLGCTTLGGITGAVALLALIFRFSRTGKICIFV